MCKPCAMKSRSRKSCGRFGICVPGWSPKQDGLIIRRRETPAPSSPPLRARCPMPWAASLLKKRPGMSCRRCSVFSSNREIYQRPPARGAPAVAVFDPQVERYFAAVSERGDAGRSELLSCAQQSTSHQLHLVNFLLQHGEKELVHTAIENTRLPLAWKL